MFLRGDHHHIIKKAHSSLQSKVTLDYFMSETSETITQTSLALAHTTQLSKEKKRQIITFDLHTKDSLT